MSTDPSAPAGGPPASPLDLRWDNAEPPTTYGAPHPQPVFGGHSNHGRVQDPRPPLNTYAALTAVGNSRPRLAVIMAKFDVLRALTEVEGSAWSRVMSNAGAAFMRDSLASGPYDEAEGRLLHEEVRSLLLRLHGGSIVAGVENPSSGIRLQHRYFAVSSLGQPPVGNRLNPRGIAPFRCIDPLRWVTADHAVL